jgi:hypothetical protein
MSKLSITAGVAAAALLAMSPAAALAQENTANTAYAAEPAANDTATDPTAANTANAADTLANEPAAATTAEPMAEEPMAEPADQTRGGGSFPWGLLGLLGLVGLLGSKRSQ